MAIDYRQNAIGAAAYIALGMGRGASAGLTATELANLEADVGSALSNVLANAIVTALGVSTAGSKAVKYLFASVEGVLANTSVRGLSATSLTNLASLIAGIYVGTQPGANATQAACGAGAVASILRDMSSSGMTLGGTVNTDLTADAAAVVTACHANGVILALEPGVAGSVVTQCLTASTEVALTGTSVHTATAGQLTDLATRIAALYTGIAAHVGANFITSTLASASFAALGVQRGGVVGATPLADLLADVDTIVAAGIANATIGALVGGAMDAAGTPGVQALTAAVRTVLEGTTVVNLSAGNVTALATQMETLYTSSLAHMGPTA
jgi:hypothetical protein